MIFNPDPISTPKPISNTQVFPQGSITSTMSFSTYTSKTYSYIYDAVPTLKIVPGASNNVGTSPGIYQFYDLKALDPSGTYIYYYSGVVTINFPKTSTVLPDGTYDVCYVLRYSSNINLFKAYIQHTVSGGYVQQKTVTFNSQPYIMTDGSHNSATYLKLVPFCAQVAQ